MREDDERNDIQSERVMEENAMHVEDLYLQRWQEVAGTCIDIAVSDTGTVIILQTTKKRYRLSLPDIYYDLDGLQGQLVAVLKTESLARPFLIRRMSAPRNAHMRTGNKR